jgi:UDP-N-acetylmuramoyl-L-alanyl-D-glutamate--2,6-diaminopimelate ligase
VTLRPEGTSGTGGDLRALLNLPPGPPDLVHGVTLDSRAVRPGDLYAALPGSHTHGARFAAQAVAGGAVAVLTDLAGRELIEGSGGVGVPVLVVEGPRGRLGAVADWLYGHPSRQLRTTGITGTNGKTTTSYLLDAALRAGGRGPTGVIGTVAIQVGRERLAASRTTPEAPDLHALLAVMLQRGVRTVTLEVSSHALSLGRVDAVVFDLAVFTNLSQDHLDFHGTIEDYFAAKAELFAADRAAAALVCVDDPWGVRMARQARAAGLPTVTFGLAGSVDADWCAVDVTAAAGSGRFTLPGRFSLANAVAAIAAAVHHGVAVGDAVAGVGDCEGVPGRMQRVGVGGEVVGIVDYAHTPDAVERAIVAVRETYGGRAIVVLGCGGDRDRQKRPLMGRVAARGADVLVITDDNPRSEEPGDIRAAIMVGVSDVEADARAEVHEQGDRRAAIREAVAAALPGDVVLVLGKGHELGQERGGVITPFDDAAELRAALGSRP